jgi:hypothetical protein
MKLLGKLEQIVELVFRKGLYIFTLKPNQSTVFTANRTYQLPPGNADQELVGISSSQELFNKTINGTTNTLSNIPNSSTTATSSDNPNTIVSRDASGNFAAGNITGNITGTASNITATSNNTLTTLSSLSLPGSQVTGNIAGNSSNVTGIVQPSNGGTGVNNGGTLTYGSENIKFRTLGNTDIWIPQIGTVATREIPETFTNKQISSTNLITGALQLPAGTSAEQPSFPAVTAGMIRYNTNTGLIEFYNGFIWSTVGGGGGGQAAAVEQVLVESGSYVSTYSTFNTGGNTAVGPNINLDAYTTYEISISGVSLISTSTFPITNADLLNYVNTEIDFKNTSTNASISGSYFPVNGIERRQAGDYLTLSSTVGFNYKFRITPSTNITIRLYSNCFSSFAFNTNPLTHSLYAVRIGLTNFGPAPI